MLEYRVALRIPITPDGETWFRSLSIYIDGNLSTMSPGDRENVVRTDIENIIHNGRYDGDETDSYGNYAPIEVLGVMEVMTDD